MCSALAKVSLLIFDDFISFFLFPFSLFCTFCFFFCLASLFPNCYLVNVRSANKNWLHSGWHMGKSLLTLKKFKCVCVYQFINRLLPIIFISSLFCCCFRCLYHSHLTHTTPVTMSCASLKIDYTNCMSEFMVKVSFLKKQATSILFILENFVSFYLSK